MKKIFSSFVMTLALSSAGHAAFSSAEVYTAKRLQVQIYKDANSLDLPDEARNQLRRFKQFAVVKENGSIIRVFAVSTGLEGNEVGPNDGSIETPNGYFTLDARQDNLPYRDSPNEPAIFLRHGLVFVDPPGEGNVLAMHRGRVTGNRASHGCIRLDADDAEWLFAKVGEVGVDNVGLAIYGIPARMTQNGREVAVQLPTFRRTDMGNDELNAILDRLDPERRRREK